MGSFSRPTTGNAVALAPSRRIFDIHDLSFGTDLESQLVPTVSRNDYPARRSCQVFHFVMQLFCSIMWITSSLGLHRVYYTQWRLSERYGSLKGLPLNAARIFAIQFRWDSIVCRMVTVWKAIWIGCTLLLPLSVAFLQVEGVLERALTRTATLSSVVFSIAGIVSSGIYLSGKVKFTSKRIRNKWKEASSYPASAGSIEFWACLALPVSSMIWSALYSMSTLLMISWTKGAATSVKALESQSEIGFLASALFITAQILVAAAQICRALKLFTET
ncbi:hypothetical protein GALMADRAFT_214076 [Galerina marginata CBS 339.88]|uniref:Uncharacterized protein n=1 Tax=Galerina marginata (strain CBS 339.88) TaxID=685588 RepID=A0A067SM08_GALM3|nr:hypothetical protein GALMADRAFT_214076 [Galerina marginata CBS 339.88]